MQQINIIFSGQCDGTSFNFFTKITRHVANLLSGKDKITHEIRQ